MLRILIVPPIGLGVIVPKSEIASSGLWNTQGLNGNVFSYREIKELKNFVMNGLPFLIFDDYVKEEQNKKLVKKHVLSEGDRVSTSDIKAFILRIIENLRRDGLEYTDIVSGEIHKQMNLYKKMPSVCSAMYQLMDKNDVVLHTTPSGKSSTIKIRYFL